jgi:hypothetical protein
MATAGGRHAGPCRVFVAIVMAVFAGLVGHMPARAARVAIMPAVPSMSITLPGVEDDDLV